MKLKLRCVGAQLQRSPKKEDEVTRFAFAADSSPLGKDGDAWPESQIQLWLCDGTCFQVGKEYTFDLSVQP